MAESWKGWFEGIWKAVLEVKNNDNPLFTGVKNLQHLDEPQWSHHRIAQKILK